jgi:hypothetical protein
MLKNKPQIQRDQRVGHYHCKNNCQSAAEAIFVLDFFKGFTSKV